MRSLIILVLTAISVQPIFGQKVYTDLVYKDNPEDPALQALNLVIPENVTNPPLFIWIGGGAWSYVDRDIEMDLAHSFAKEGIAVASVGHRLSSATWKDPSLVTDNKHPDHIEDIASAVHWLIKHAAKYGYDADNLFIGGYSSGAHLAALLTMNAKYLEAHDLHPTVFSGVIPLAGAYDVADYHAAFKRSERWELAALHVEAVFGDSEEEWLDASPTTFAKNYVVPMLLISESQSYNYTRLLENELKYKPGFEVKHFTELDHSGLWREISTAESSECRSLMLDFIHSKEIKQSQFD